MKGYLIPASCSHCGGTLDHVVSSKVWENNDTSAVCKCSRCSREWQISVLLRPVVNPASVRRQSYRRSHA